MRDAPESKVVLAYTSYTLGFGITTFYNSYPDYCEDSFPMAVVYTIPWLPAHSQFNSERHIQQLFREIPNQFADVATVTAAYRCPGGLPDGDGAQYGKRVYPGVIFLGRYWTDFAGDDLRAGIIWS
jgi:hypothetical protein